jgi:hypothetical protein
LGKCVDGEFKLLVGVIAKIQKLFLRFVAEVAKENKSAKTKKIKTKRSLLQRNKHNN